MIILVIGGIRSGKSAGAEKLLARKKRVAYLATNLCRDAEMRERMRRHRARRPASWTTIEAGDDLETALARTGNAEGVLLDCLTGWLANRMQKKEKDEKIIDRLSTSLAAMKRRRRTQFVIVADEVGLGGVSGNRVARRFADLAGKANQVAAEAADRVYFYVAGMEQQIK